MLIIVIIDFKRYPSTYKLFNTRYMFLLLLLLLVRLHDHSSSSVDVGGLLQVLQAPL